MSEKIIQDLIASLNTKLDIIIKLMVLLKAQDKNQSEQIWLLSAAGLQPKEIANILGTTPNTVRVILFGLRKRKAKVKKVYAEGAED
jgi:DNA-binding CsgD family transcriptional regulator